MLEFIFFSLLFVVLEKFGQEAFSQKLKTTSSSSNPTSHLSMDPKCLLSCLLLTALMGFTNPGLVKKILRHRRQTLSSPKGNNISLPDTGHPVVFNHVYSINVPASSLCSVNLDSPDSIQLQPQDAAGHLGAEHTVDGENQIVFTHRINIPRQACGCTDEMSMLKDLMSRLEVLEGEVSVLRDQCNADRACCAAQVTGGFATIRNVGQNLQSIS